MKNLPTLLITLLAYQSVFSQAITAKLDLGVGEVKAIDISESGNEWVITTDSHIILWDDVQKKVRWKSNHSNQIYSSERLKHPRQAVISGSGIYQVNGNTNAIEKRDIADGSISESISIPKRDFYFGMYTVVKVEGKKNRFIVPSNLPSRLKWDTLISIGEDQFLFKNLPSDGVKFTPNGKYFLSRYRHDYSNYGDLTHEYYIYGVDDGHFASIKRPLSKRFNDKTTKVKAIVPGQDGKHVLRGRYVRNYNYEPEYAIEKIFGLTKKVVSSHKQKFEPLLMDYFGSKNQLVVFSSKKHEFEWVSVNVDSWSVTTLNLQIPDATSLFNDPSGNRLFVADKNGGLWILEEGNPSNQIAMFSASGEQKSVRQVELASNVAAAKSSAEQEDAINQINRSNESPRSNPNYYSDKAFEFSDKGMYDAAEAAMKKIYDVNKDQAVFVGYMAWFKLLNKKSAEAKKLAIKAYELAPFDPLAPTVASYAHIGQNDLNGAKKYMKIAVGNTVESKSDDDIGPDVQMLKGRGYDRALLDQLYSFYKQAFTNVMVARSNNLSLFQQAQKDVSPSGSLSKLQTVIKNEEAFLAPRPELLGAAYSEATAKSRDLGKVEQAKKYGKKSVEILKPYAREGLLCGALVNAGHAYNQAGEKDEAINYYEKGLELINKLGGSTKVYKEGALNGLGGAYQDIGEYNRALTYYEEALKEAKSGGKSVDIAIAQDNIATVYIEQGKNVSQALSLLQRGQSAYSAAGDREAQAKSFNNIAFAYMLLGKLNEAVDAFKKAERIFSSLSMKSSLADINRSIGKLLMMLDQKIDAISYYKKSLQYADEDADPRTAMSTYANLAGAELGQEDYVNAASHARKAIGIHNRLIKNAKGKTKRGLRSSANNTYRILTLANFRSGNFAQAFEAHEKNRSLEMLEKMGGGLTASANSVQSGLTANQAMIDYSVVHLHWEVNSHLFPIVLTNSMIKGREFSDSTLVYDLKQEGEATFSAYLKNERSMLKQIREFVQEKGIPDNVAQSLVRDSNLEKTIEFYRYLIKNPSVPNEVLRKSYARVFYDLLIGNISSLLNGKNELIIIPDGPLAFLPFETLINENGQYLAETHRIKYIQSASILKKLDERNYSSSRQPLLAFGGPVFQEMSSQEVNRYRGTSNSVDFSDIQRTYYEAEEGGSSMRPTYIKMGFTKMNPLPGTIYETNQIREIVAGAKLYQNDQASENQFKSLAAANTLKNYKVLHFATHGWAYGEIPELSTIVLGQYSTPRGNEDGYLRVPEIEKLNLNADFVNLSACETALGRLYSSEGVVGLTQAFLVAGAKGISVTQWTVSDEGTAIFMSEMYKKVFNNGKSFQDAIADTKVEFINGTYGEKFKHPDYWGPFVYYGI